MGVDGVDAVDAVDGVDGVDAVGWRTVETISPSYLSGRCI